MAGSRTKARKRALDVLFESELQSREVGATLDGRVAAGDPPVNPYTIELVEGVREHRDRIDVLLEEYAQGWSLERMPAVDRNLLRIGAYEVLYREDVPDAVAVSEAVNLAAELSTDDSPTFVRGLLSRLVEVKPTLSA
ncbi:transcription antitermination factor NusB [Mumia sp. DW29H23]|uniref:transcription antitermination factor NusB n=1 Tax=Mumia sp. DW29H23 TaxID=3421241 RepID=UPI003D69AE9D